MLAAAAIGAIWASCSPDFGEQGVLDRFAQIEPKLAVALASKLARIAWALMARGGAYQALVLRLHNLEAEVARRRECGEV